MANTSNKSNQGQGATSSGHGSLGMGGQPSDAPRDLRGGGDGRAFDDQGSGTGPIGGASGASLGDDAAGGGTANETMGVQGDKALDDMPKS